MQPFLLRASTHYTSISLLMLDLSIVKGKNMMYVKRYHVESWRPVSFIFQLYYKDVMQQIRSSNISDIELHLKVGGAMLIVHFLNRFIATSPWYLKNCMFLTSFFRQLSHFYYCRLGQIFLWGWWRLFSILTHFYTASRNVKKI